MDLIVRTDDRIRIESGSQGSVFVDVNSNNCQLGIDFTFYEMHNLKLIEKDRTFKMFVIPKKYPIDEFDLGWWKDGKVVWQSI